MRMGGSSPSPVAGPSCTVGTTCTGSGDRWVGANMAGVSARPHAAQKRAAGVSAAPQAGQEESSSAMVRRRDQLKQLLVQSAMLAGSPVMKNSCRSEQDASVKHWAWQATVSMHCEGSVG